MKWEPKECQPGDMIRIRLGRFYHYGIFVSENEVIQFGLPPTAENREKEGEVVVLATDINTFACSSIVETACPDRSELKKRFPPEKTIALARSRIGQGGYHILHHNCEHFVNECVFGDSYCAQAEDARQRWLNRPICDVYVAVIPQEVSEDGTLPEKRNREIDKIADPDRQRQERFCWQLLSLAARRSFHLELQDAGLKRRLGGKWVSSRFHFSVSYENGLAAVAVSNGTVSVAVGQQGGDVVRTLREPHMTVSLSAQHAAAVKFFLSEPDQTVLLGKQAFE